MSVLDRINQPNDIKYLSETQLEELPGEIRQFLIEKISVTGGHLASIFPKPEGIWHPIWVLWSLRWRCIWC